MNNYLIYLQDEIEKESQKLNAVGSLIASLNHNITLGEDVTSGIAFILTDMAEHLRSLFKENPPPSFK